MDFLTSREFLGVLGIVCLIVFGWTAVVCLIAQFGWARFAALHPCAVRPQAPGFRASHAGFGGLGGYNNVVMARFVPEGVYVQATFPFNVGHRPFLLPWSCLREAEVKQRLFARRFVVILRCEAGELRMTLPKKAQAALVAAHPL